MNAAIFAIRTGLEADHQNLLVGAAEAKERADQAAAAGDAERQRKFLISAEVCAKAAEDAAAELARLDAAG